MIPQSINVSKIKLALLNVALLLSLAVAGTHTAFAQATARATPAPTPAEAPAKVTQAEVDATIPDDPAVDKMLEAYSPKVKALDQVIGKLNGDLRRANVGAGALGNFVTDGIRAEASQKLGVPVPLAVTNSGGLRRNVIPEGDLTLRDVFELLPFENALVAFDLTGKQVIELLRIVTTDHDAQSGARVTYKINDKKQVEFETAKWFVNGSEKEIDPNAIYTIICIDYLLNVTGGDYAAVLKQSPNIRPLNLTTRDAITDYIKQQHEIKPVLDGRWVFDKANSAVSEEPR